MFQIILLCANDDVEKLLLKGKDSFFCHHAGGTGKNRLR